MYEGDFLAESRKLAEGIQNIAGKKLLDKHGNPLYSGRTVGYVCNVYPEGDEWEGTIDVQEFNKNYDDEKADVGLHEHVRISAIQNNKSGVLLVPQLYSEVVIVQDPASQEEYVISFSHVDIIQMNSHQKASIGVTETEEFVEDQDDDKDFDNLEKTGSSAHTYYDKDSITDIVTEHDKEGDDETKNQDGTVSRKVTKDKIVEQIGEKTTLTTENTKRTLQIGDNLTIVMDGSGKIDINANGTTVTIDSKGQSTKIGGSDSAQITVDSGGNVIVGEAADNAVLFSELNTLLSKLFNYLASALTATQIGPQPLSTGPQIGALSGELPKIMSKKVKIAK
jgi:hypothetical protein